MHKQLTVNLRLRLKNCLQTILDLESDLARLEMGRVLLKDYSLLRAFADNTRAIALQEDEVARIEQATGSLLDELKLPLSLVYTSESQHRVMQ